MDLEFLYDLGLAWCNALTMLRDRGFAVDLPDEEPLKVACNIYAKAVENGLSLAEAAHVHCETKGRTAGLYMFDRNYDPLRDRARMVSTDQVKAMNQVVEHDKYDVRIVLCPNKLSPQAKKESLDAELFLFSEVCIVLPRHELVPLHRVVTEDFVKDHLGASMDVRDLPKIPLTDAVARWYAWPIGTLIRVENPVMPVFRIVQ